MRPIRSRGRSARHFSQACEQVLRIKDLRASTGQRVELLSRLTTISRSIDWSDGHLAGRLNEDGGPEEQSAGSLRPENLAYRSAGSVREARFIRAVKPRKPVARAGGRLTKLTRRTIP